MRVKAFRTADREEAQALADAISVRLGLPKVSVRADGRPSPHDEAARAYLAGPRIGPPPPGLTLEVQPRRVRKTEEWKVQVLGRHRRQALGVRFRGRTLADGDLLDDDDADGEEVTRDPE